MIAEFAQIVGLLASFSSGRQADEILSDTEFLKWLTEHNHIELRKNIEQNQVTCISIKTILRNRLEDVNGKLDDISNKIAIIASRSEGIEDLAIAYAKTSISEQAIEILSLMESNETEYFLLSREMGTKSQRLILSSGPNYLCKESRFFRDDLELLLGLGLLLEDSNSSGDPMFYFTRAASKLVKSVK